MNVAQGQDQAETERLRAQIASADAVVLGEVIEIHPLAGTSNYPVGRVSEHQPDWHEAVLKVSSVIKGSPGEQMVIRFPISRDIAWYRAPKLQVGQQGVFMLTLDRVTGTSESTFAGRLVSAYTALQPGDVLSPSEADRVRTISAAPK